MENIDFKPISLEQVRNIFQNRFDEINKLEKQS